jgi:hypothetical protein
MKTGIERILPALVGLVLACCAGATFATCRSAPHSNIGCEFYAVTLPNAFADPTMYSFGVRALNPSASQMAALQISGGGLLMPQSHPLAAGAIADVTLPWVEALSNAGGTVLVAGGAYHLVSDAPVSIVQFNTDSPTSPTNDATLLMPVQNAGRSFFVNVWPAFVFYEPAQVAIVATAAATTVQISGQNLQSGAGLTSSGGSVQMNAGDVLLLSSTLEAVDISGMAITSGAPVIVFSAHAGSYIPSDTGYSDHLEDAQPALPELAQDYLLVRPSDPTGGNGAKQFVKLLGTVDNTNLTFDPSGAFPATIAAGATVTIEATTDLHLHANHPVAVMQFMEGADAFVGNNTYRGDPSQLASIPSNRGALAMDFVAPMSLAPIFAQIIAPTGAQVSIDNSLVTGWTAIGSSGYSGANVALCCTDAHHATANVPFTLSVYAYPAAATATSFWYAGGIGPSDDIFGDGFE